MVNNCLKALRLKEWQKELAELRQRMSPPAGWRLSLWPRVCVACGAACRDRDLCRECRADFAWVELACERCGMPVPVSSPCGACLDHPPPFDCCRSAVWYTPPASQLIASFKYRHQLSCGRVLAELLADRLTDHPPAELMVDALVPVPLHWTRRWRRGFNQAEELARWLSRATGKPILPAVSRIRSTPPQQGLDAAARRRNLQRAFRLRRPVTGLRLALIDDVVTTASTGAAMARLLKHCGASRVELWCIARTPPRSMADNRSL